MWSWNSLSHSLSNILHKREIIALNKSIVSLSIMAYEHKKIKQIFRDHKKV